MPIGLAGAQTRSGSCRGRLPIPFSPAAAPSGGFTSAVALCHLASATRRPTRSRWCSRAPWRCPARSAASGNVGYNKPLTQTGSVGVSGALSATGNITFGQDFPVVAPLDIQAIAGALSVTGNLTISTNPSLVLVQSGAVAVNGALSTTGNPRSPEAAAIRCDRYVGHARHVRQCGFRVADPAQHAAAGRHSGRDGQPDLCCAVQPGAHCACRRRRHRCGDGQPGVSGAVQPRADCAGVDRGRDRSDRESRHVAPFTLVPTSALPSSAASASPATCRTPRSWCWRHRRPALLRSQAR